MDKGVTINKLIATSNNIEEIRSKLSQVFVKIDNIIRKIKSNGLPNINVVNIERQLSDARLHSLNELDEIKEVIDEKINKTRKYNAEYSDYFANIANRIFNIDFR